MSASKAEMLDHFDVYGYPEMGFSNSRDVEIYGAIRALIDRYGDGVTVTRWKLKELAYEVSEHDDDEVVNRIIEFLADLGITVKDTAGDGEEKK